MPDFAELPVPAWRDDLEHEYAALAARLEPLVPCLEIPLHLPWIDAINKLKKQRGAVIMAHSYQSPEIFHGVADVTGDSLGLAQAARDCDAELIVMCGVHFMAESAKILAPHKTVLIPDLAAGCSLASSITAADVRALKARHTGVELVLWHGRCEVHEKFTAQQARHARETFDAKLVAHPECPPEVLAEADFVGSTTAMGKWLARRQPARVALITECSMADNLRAQCPQTEFIKPCNLCPHMQRITLQNIYAALRDLKHAIEIPADVIAGARRALERMLAVGRRETV